MYDTRTGRGVCRGGRKGRSEIKEKYQEDCVREFMRAIERVGVP